LSNPVDSQTKIDRQTNRHKWKHNLLGGDNLYLIARVNLV